MVSVVHPPGQLPVVEDTFDWNTTTETKWYYGGIAFSTKILTATRIGAPITVLSWQNKRFNCRSASHSTCAEGSLRLLCDSCSKFQIFSPQNNPHLTSQGCSMCISKVGLLDTTLQVSFLYWFIHVLNV